jgi:hypothetical protein
LHQSNEEYVCGVKIMKMTLCHYQFVNQSIQITVRHNDLKMAKYSSIRPRWKKHDFTY